MRDTLREIGVTSAIVRTAPWGMVVDQTAVTACFLILRGHAAPWVIDAAKKLEAIGRLPSGWDSYGGAPLDLNARRLTVSAIGWLGGENLPVPAVVLGSGGTVQLEWRAGGKELEIELDKDGIEFLKVHANKEMEEGEAKADLPQQLKDLSWWLLHG